MTQLMHTLGSLKELNWNKNRVKFKGNVDIFCPNLSRLMFHKLNFKLKKGISVKVYCLRGNRSLSFSCFCYLGLHTQLSTNVKSPL